MASQKIRQHRTFKYRLALLISIVVIIPLGYTVRFYEAAPEWLNNLFGNIAYQIFWMLLVALFLPQASPLWTAVGVCLASFGVEFLQLWQPPFLQAIRATLPGRLVLGNTFFGWDFPCYVIGSFFGWLWMRLLYQRFKVINTTTTAPL